MFTFQIYAAKTNGIHFDLGALTVDPQSAAYDPRPLIPYLAELGLTYLYESQNIMEQVKIGGAATFFRQTLFRRTLFRLINTWDRF